MNKTFASLLLSTGFVVSAHAQTPPNTLITYAVIDKPEVVDVAPVGPSVGDMYLRHGDVMFTPDGEAVGTYFSKGTIVMWDKAKKMTATAFSSELVLPEGTIYKTDFVQGTLNAEGKYERASAGHKHQGAILGGTGKYAGIRGAYEIEVMDSGKLGKTTHQFWLGQ